jgi:hypothetical protein
MAADVAGRALGCRESLWSVSGENIRADVQQLIDQYNVSGTGSGGSSGL